MKKIIVATLLAVVLTVGLVDTANAEDVWQEMAIDEYYCPDTSLCITWKLKVIWELPVSQADTLTKSEWRDIGALIGLLGTPIAFSYTDAFFMAIVDNLAPKRFLKETK